MLFYTSGIKAIKGLTHFVNQLHNDQLENVAKSMNLVNTCAEVIQSSILEDVNDLR